LGIAKVLNQGEVAQAQAVVSRLPAGPAKEFAEMMIAHHGQALQQEEALGRELQLQPMGDHPIAAELNQKSQAMIRELERAEASRIASVYMTAQVTAHEEALRLVEQTLLPATTRQVELRNHLQQMRATIQSHLTRAREIQPQLATR
jgi:putative membrane protein